MLKVIILAVLMALGSAAIAVSGYGRVEKPALGGNGALAIQIPEGVQAPPYHQQPSLEWWAARHGARVSSIGLNECLGCHKPETSCNSCHAYVGVKLINAVEPGPVAVAPTAILEALDTPVPPTDVPTTAPVATVQPTVSTTFPNAATASPTIVTVTAVPSATSSPTAVAAKVPSFAKDILPLLQTHCTACHGAFGGWDAASYERMMTTGNFKPAIVPGKPDASLLIQKLTKQQKVGMSMPPGESLPLQEIDLFVRWVAAGAPDN